MAFVRETTRSSIRYSFMEHLARSVLFSRYADNVLLAMIAGYSAYFDASGHPDRRSELTVAGFASTVKKWTRFDLGWNEILKSEGIKVSHMTDFVSSQGEFAVGWKGETSKRKAFIDRLAQCIKLNVNKSFRTTLVIADFNSVNELYQLEEFLGRPYALCSMVCTCTLRQWAQRKRAGKRLLYYFEDGDKDKGNFEQMHRAAYRVAPKFLDKSEAIAFQAADFAGWKIRSNIEQAIKSDHTLEQGIRLLQSVAMLRRIPKDAGVINRDVLLRYCAAWNVAKREARLRT